MSVLTHVPVMCTSVWDHLAPALTGDAPVVVDCTLGAGGHAEACLTRFPTARLVGIDRDPAALALARERLAVYGDRLTTYQGPYDELPQALAAAGVQRVAAVLFDLGLSSMQIDAVDRGFAYATDAPLDMRMNPADPLTAADVINTYPADALALVLRRYGDERHARRIADAIVARRAHAPFARSADLVAVIAAAVPATPTGGHPAKRTFQALRIEVNGERESLDMALPAALAVLAPAGRLAVLSYHSGEDRLVKALFRDAATDHVPPGLPVVPVALAASYRLVTRGALRPTGDEIADNPRARPARLRVIERIKE